MAVDVKKFYEEMRGQKEDYRRLGRAIHEVIGKNTAIDLGCGVGCQTAQLAELGWKILGIDPETDVPATGFPFIKQDVLAQPDQLYQADVVICTETAEHMPDEQGNALVAWIARAAQKTIVWSAAQPGQEWEGHINLRPSAYWIEKYKVLGWVPDWNKTCELRDRMLQTKAQHWMAAHNFFVLTRGPIVMQVGPDDVRVRRMAPPPEATGRIALLTKRPEIVVVDDFLPDPDKIRELALKQQYGKQGSAGVRSRGRFHDLIGKDVFEHYLHGAQITDWEAQPANGKFQFCVSEDPIVYHADTQSYAAVIQLTPDAPPESGTSFYRSKRTGVRRAPTDAQVSSATFDGKLLDRTAWELVDKIGNVYNRLVLWDARMIHAASCYFGNAIEDARLFWMFFFSTD